MEGSPALAVADGGRIAAGLRKLAQDGLGLAHHRDAALRALHTMTTRRWRRSSNEGRSQL